MKLFFLSAFTMFSAAAFAQPKIVTQAVITTSTNVIAPDDEDVSQVGGQGGGMNMANFMDGETKSTTYIKGSLVKTNYKSEVFRGSVYRNNDTKRTTTVFEIMGNKRGFYMDDDDTAFMRKRADSIMHERMKTDTSMKGRTVTAFSRSSGGNATVAYTEETKKIAGYNCKKAYIITDKLLTKDSMAVWYTPEIKFPNVASTGGTSGIGSFGGKTNFDKVDGFVMAYEMSMPRGRKMEVKVTKIETDKEIPAKEFDLPTDVEIKSMKEMNQGGGGMRFMMRP